jgi:inorganic pyrophosphatase
LDVLILGEEPLEPGCFVDIRPIGYLQMEDEKGIDEKLLAVAAKDPRQYEVRTLRNVPEHVLREITQFFETYKTLEKGKWVRVGEWKGTADAKQLVESTHIAYCNEQQAKSKKN